MSKRLLMALSVFVLILWLSACGARDQPMDEPDVDATVEAAIAATRAAETAAEPPPDTPIPPTPTPEPESPPALDGQVLDLNEAAVHYAPQGRNYATNMAFRLKRGDEVVNALVIEGVKNADGDSAITYDFSHTSVAAVLRTVTHITVGDATYFSLADGSCVSAVYGAAALDDLVVDTGRILLDTGNIVTGPLQWSRAAEVHGISTDEYVIGIDNLARDVGIIDMTYGVLNIAQEGNYVVRLILQGQGASGVLAPEVPGELYYELAYVPSDSRFEIEVPAACLDLDVGAMDDEDPDHAGHERDDAVDDAVDDVVLVDEIEVVISQGSQNISHHCQGGNVVIESATSNISLTGKCNEVVVNGTVNNIDIEAAAAIIVNGTGNNITYDGSPAITNRGLGNVISRR